MATIQPQLAKIVSQTDQRARIESYKQLLGQVLRAGNSDDLKAFVEHRIMLIFFCYYFYFCPFSRTPRSFV